MLGRGKREMRELAIIRERSWHTKWEGEQGKREFCEAVQRGPLRAVIAS